MLRLILLVALATITVAVPSYKNRCFECECIREKTYTEEYQIPVKIPRYNKVCNGYACEGKVEYDVVYEKHTRTVTRPRSGVDVCMGPLYALTAVSKGASFVGCRGPCFTRQNEDGNVQRGCSDGHNMDVTTTKCYRDGGFKVCLCQGKLCNNAVMPLSID